MPAFPTRDVATTYRPAVGTNDRVRGTLSIDPHLSPMRIDPATALTPATEAVAVHLVLVVDPAFPATRNTRTPGILARR